MNSANNFEIVLTGSPMSRLMEHFRLTEQI